MNHKYDVLIVGGGAAGYFTAINTAEKSSNLSIAILERGKEVLGKVKISGGGRCNVTHACFEPKELVKFYPRGRKELLGPFHTFCTGDTMGWFGDRGVDTKIEDDNRVFPTSNNSSSIVNCLIDNAKKNKIELRTNERLEEIIPPNDENKSWIIITQNGSFECEKLVLTTGSNPKIWKLLSRIGYKIEAPVPSLFTFNIKDERIKDLQGLSVPKAIVKINKTNLKAIGPLLITHWGMSGPAILKLSAWGARELNDKQYKFNIQVNWLNKTTEEIQDFLLQFKQNHPKKFISKNTLFELPSRLWLKFTNAAKIHNETKWADTSNKTINKLAVELTQGNYQVNGKSTFKDEFVTAGGIELNQVDFKRFESKLHPNLYFAGEILNIDAITGGFNFQAAWTGAWIISQAISNQKVQD